MRKRSRSRRPRTQVGTRSDLPHPSPLRSKDLLLFPKAVSYHASLSKEDPGTIRQVSCKQGYLAIVKTDRTVIVYDRAEDGGCQRSPQRIKLNKGAKVDLLDSEASHLLILSSEGKLSEHSIASRGSKPRLLKELGDKRIVQIACGDHHSLALSKGGELFAWGQNDYGQVAAGREINPITEPRLVWELEGIPLAKIAAGSAHSVVLSVFGTVYSWGKNAYGQLGLGDTEERRSPTIVKALEHEKTVFVSCGGEHTAVLSKDGLVCTFGDGSCGQLGHNSRRNELLPRLVAELFGARVSQVACGRRHTLIYVAELGEIYSFGSGAERQLGQGGKCDRLIPLPIGRKFNRVGNASEELVKIIAGENQSIVLLLKEKKSYANLNRSIARVEEEKTDKWVSNSDPNCWQTMKQDVKLIFSSAACINGSFVEKRAKHFRTSLEVAAVDMSAVLLFCEKISTKPKVFTVVIKALKKLLQSVSDFPGSPEALRVFLIVPILLRREDSQSDHLLLQLAQAIWRRPQKEKQLLESLWANLEIAFFKDLVSVYQRLATAKLSSAIEHARCSEKTLQDVDFFWLLHVLRMLYEVNCRRSFRIQESNFHIPEVKKLLAFLMTDLNLPLIELLRKLAKFPFIFEMEVKVFMYRAECSSRNLMAAFAMTSELLVRRQYLIQDTWQSLRNANRDHQPLRVRFVGEPGIDDGGPCQEFFTVIGRELCAPEKQIFRHFEESHLIWFSHQVPAQEDIYFLIGKLFGKALYNMKIAAFPFPLALFKKMANIQPTLEDLKELSPVVGSNLQAVLDEDYEDVIENMMLDFTITEEHDGSIVDVELKENGANIPVTKCNRKEYVDAYVNYMFGTSVEKQFGDFMCGFKIGCPSEIWKMFLPAELRVVLLGHTKYDWEQLEKNAKYHGYERSDETIEDFWAVFHALPEEKKKNFLSFLTGTDCIPAQGMGRFTVTIADLRREDADQWYPEACTCSRVLHLPRYSNKDVLQNMLLVALENYEKFGLS
ncbi:E3 ISG15--protein ligase HERC5 isoform X2 [Zootoca vivipara]|uniref:E3 ISG15--protein ligase HERC5 isoform X2 n=1 Tax=Zootoca vivipara TaxID=8524 RepID=UPI0015920A19|nr:E3 ISG15--protein ligase HERC5 isoform X2 [Zootoca vivipara]